MFSPFRIVWTYALAALPACLLSEFLNVYTIDSLDHGATVGYQLAFKEINKNEDLLPDYTLRLIELHTGADTTIAVQQVLNLTHDARCSCTNNTETKYISVPIVLGQRSSICSITAPILNNVQWAQISSYATSIELSDNAKYPTFYRTISDDSLQAAGIVGMLKHFEWTNIAVVYVNDLYGGFLAIEIMNLASADDTTEFQVIPIAFNDGDTESIETAVRQLRVSGVFIAILITHSNDISVLFSNLKTEGVWGYPYYYIGVDSWIDSVETIISKNMTSFTQGYLGTAPWESSMLSKTDYAVHVDLERMYNASSEKQHYFQEFWEEQYQKDASIFYRFRSPPVLSYYGWDSAYTIAYILQHILEENGTLDHVDTTNIDWIDEIITEQINFIGVTGNVSFQDNGDRDKGVFAFGNILANGSISWIGYFSDFYGTTYFDEDSIVWPQDFVDRNMTPRTSVLIHTKMLSINSALFITMSTLAGISILIAMILMALTLKYSNEPIIRAASWRLNIAACIGAMMAYIFVIISGLDEGLLTETQITRLCVIKYWLLSMAFTLGLMPLFLKTYRVSLIFTESLKSRKNVGDIHLMLELAVCLIVDVLLFAVYTALSPHRRNYVNGSLEVIDQLQSIQHIFGHCLFGDSTLENVFRFLIGSWKSLQILFGIYCCFMVSHTSISGPNRKVLQKYDETSTQLNAVVTAILLIAIIAVCNALLPGEEINWEYAVQSAGILTMCNMGLIVNLCPRLIAIWRDEVEQFNHSLEDEIEAYFIEKMRRFALEKVGSGEYEIGKHGNLVAKKPRSNLKRKKSGQHTQINSESNFDIQSCGSIIATNFNFPKIDEGVEMQASTLQNASKNTSFCAQSSD